MPASSISTATALTGGTGGQSNVYWAAASSSAKQQWTVSPSVDGGGTSNPYAGLNWRYAFRTSSGADDNAKNFGNFCYDPNATVPPEYHKHMGIDVNCSEGLSLYSPAAGRVVAYGGAQFVTVTDTNTTVPSDTLPDSNGGRGYFAVLEMDQKDPLTNKTMYIRYLHMQSLPNLAVNQRVAASTIIGKVGNTGDSGTAHLHLDISNMPLSSLPWNGNNQTASNMINPVNVFPNVSFPATYYAIGSYL